MWLKCMHIGINTADEAEAMRRAEITVACAT